MIRNTVPISAPPKYAPCVSFSGLFIYTFLSVNDYVLKY